MNELKQKLTALGLSEDIADKVIQTVAEFAKSKMPEQYQGLVDQALNGQTPDVSNLGEGLLGKVKGMFGDQA